MEFAHHATTFQKHDRANLNLIVSHAYMPTELCNITHSLRLLWQTLQDGGYYAGSLRCLSWTWSSCQSCVNIAERNRESCIVNSCRCWMCHKIFSGPSETGRNSFIGCMTCTSPLTMLSTCGSGRVHWVFQARHHWIASSRRVSPASATRSWPSIPPSSGR